jgi:hypothetical protein
VDVKLSLQDVFSQNRAEELGHDVWKYFVIPPFYSRLDLYTARKPRVIIGGRGCGKTMLLRYLSHNSIFSPNRQEVPSDVLSHIGVYWKADTQFCSAMAKRGVSEDIWHAAFNHIVALMLGLELMDSLNSMSNSKFEMFSSEDILKLDFKELRAFNSDLPSSFAALYKHLRELLWELEAWVTDVRKAREPLFLAGAKFIRAMIDIIRAQSPSLQDAVFFVYIDEYENLLDYQKRIINTWLKHSEVPLIFNLAMKRNSFAEKRTLGEESLSDIHDYRQHDLEEYLREFFPIFAAEILFLQLSIIKYDVPIDIEGLRNPASLPKRLESDYGARVLEHAQKLFPDVSQADMANMVFSDGALRAKLEEKVVHALRVRKSTMPTEKFIEPDFPEASIVMPALLYRKRLTPEHVAEEMDLLSKNAENRFTGATGWIHNNFIGSLLQLYAPYARPCPFYAGFRTFTRLSRGNIRHFLELCHKSLLASSNAVSELTFPVDPIRQAEAARRASAAFLGEIRSFGPKGNQLHTFVLRLGSFFSLAHRRPTQSESEQSHFSIRNGVRKLSREDEAFLSEAIKWSVLLEHIETKKKEDYLPETIEYILNPIYAPYFHISYRKKRKLELSIDEVITLIRGNLDEFTSLLKTYSRKWNVERDEMSPIPQTLFD